MTSKTLSPTPTPVLPIRAAPDIDIPNSFFIDHSGLRLHIDWPAVCGRAGGGIFEVPLDPVTKASFLDVTGFRRINMLVSGTKAAATLHVGKWSPSTACEAHSVPADGHIHSFDVTGPHIHVSLGGTPACGVEDVQLWVYLRS
jgi:hypothetical protein